MSYAIKQNRWVEENEVEENSIVLVKEKLEPSDWHNAWVEPMDNFIGHKYKVREIQRDGIVLSSQSVGSSFIFPFYCLECTSCTAFTINWSQIEK